MPTSTSGTTNFSLDVDQIIEQAVATIGGEHQSSGEASKARVALNLLLIELSNKNIPLHKLGTEELTLIPNQAGYVLPQAIEDVLKVSVSVTPTDLTTIPIQRYSLKEFHTIPTKEDKGRPNIFCTERLRDSVTIKFWKVPDLAYKVSLLAYKQVEDVTASYQKLDLPSRYLPLVVQWLSYKIALTREGFPLDKLGLMKTDLAQTMEDAFDEDRERTDFTVIPGGISGR